MTADEARTQLARETACELMGITMKQMDFPNAWEQEEDTGYDLSTRKAARIVEDALARLEAATWLAAAASAVDIPLAYGPWLSVNGVIAHCVARAHAIVFPRP